MSLPADLATAEAELLTALESALGNRFPRSLDLGTAL